MKYFLYFLLIFFLFSSCVDVEEISEPCIVKMNDGTTRVIEEDIKINQRTGTITYRQNDRLWSIFKEDYESYACGSK